MCIMMTIMNKKRQHYKYRHWCPGWRISAGALCHWSTELALYHPVRSQPCETDTRRLPSEWHDRFYHSLTQVGHYQHTYLWNIIHTHTHTLTITVQENQPLLGRSQSYNGSSNTSRRVLFIWCDYAPLMVSGIALLHAVDSYFTRVNL